MFLNKISGEYLAALHEAGNTHLIGSCLSFFIKICFMWFQGNAAKARLCLIKSHCFEMVNALQSRTDEVIKSLERLVNKQFSEEIKRFVFYFYKITSNNS